MSAGLAYVPAEPEPNRNLARQHYWPSDSQSGRFAFATPAEVHSFGPADFISVVHPSLKRHRFRASVVFGIKRGNVWSQRTATGDGAIKIAEELVAGERNADLYVSMNSFKGPRTIEALAGMGCCFSDIDYRSVESLAGASPRAILTIVLGGLKEDGIPAPSFAMDSGRGLYLIWLHDRVPAVALKRWNHVQHRIQTCLRPFGADPAAKDAARVLRLPGSMNSKAAPDRRRVGLLWYQGSASDPYRYDFDSFADEVLPHTRFEIRSIRAERAKRQAAGTSQARPQARRRDGGSYGEAILSDLERIRMFRNSNGILEAGQRDKWLFVAAMALTWMCPPDAVEAEITALAMRTSGWSQREAFSRMSSVLGRARRAEAGETATFNGHEVDARYRMKASTIIAWLEITPEEQKAADLRILLDDDVRRDRKVQAERQRRQDKGAKSRAETQAERLALGRRAVEMQAVDGLTLEQIASKLKVSRRQIAKAMNEARKAA